MRFIILMLIAMIAGGVIGKYVDDKILFPVLVGLLIVSSIIKLYVNYRGRKSSSQF